MAYGGRCQQRGEFAGPSAPGAPVVAFRIASPPGYGFGEEQLARLRAAGTEVHSFEDPWAAVVAGADAVYTDVWASMGQEGEAEQAAARTSPASR